MSNSFWNKRNAFVTGATSFVGAHIARLLVEQGARVICLQRDVVRANSLDLFDLRRHVTVVNGSVEDFALMERVVNEYEVEAVFHLAAQAIVGEFLKTFAEFPPRQKPASFSIDQALEKARQQQDTLSKAHAA